MKTIEEIRRDTPDVTTQMAEALEEARVQVSILQDRLGIKDSGAGTLSIIDAALKDYREADHV